MALFLLWGFHALIILEISLSDVNRNSSWVIWQLWIPNINECRTSSITTLRSPMLDLHSAAEIAVWILCSKPTWDTIDLPSCITAYKGNCKQIWQLPLRSPTRVRRGEMRMSPRMVSVTVHEQFKTEAWDHDREKREIEREGSIGRGPLYRRTCSRIVHPFTLADMIDISVRTVAQLISVLSVVLVNVWAIYVQNPCIVCPALEFWYRHYAGKLKIFPNEIRCCQLVLQF